MKLDALPSCYFDFQVRTVSDPPIQRIIASFLLALRSIGLKCMDHLFFYKIIAGESEGLDTYLLDLLNLEPQ